MATLPTAADFSLIGAATLLNNALSHAHLTLPAWFATHPTITRVEVPAGPELRYAPKSQLLYLDSEGVAFLSGDEHLVEHHPYWLLDAADILTCLDVLAVAAGEVEA